MLIDFQAIFSFITEACGHYEKSAPQLSEWLNGLYVDLNHEPRKVSAYELHQLCQLRMDGEWEHPNYAQNRWYKLRALAGRPCGVLSF